MGVCLQDSGLVGHVNDPQQCVSDTESRLQACFLLKRHRESCQSGSLGLFLTLLSVLDVLQGQLGKLDLTLLRRHHGLCWRQRFSGFLGLIGGELVKSHTVFIICIGKMHVFGKMTKPRS